MFDWPPKIQASENIEIFKVKLRRSKSLRLLQRVAFLVFTQIGLVMILLYFILKKIKDSTTTTTTTAAAAPTTTTTTTTTATFDWEMLLT